MPFQSAKGHTVWAHWTPKRAFSGRSSSWLVSREDGCSQGALEEGEEVRSKLRHLWFTRLLGKGPRTHPGGQGDRMPERLSGLIVCCVYSEHFPEGVISGHWGEAFCLEFKRPVYHMLVGPQFPHLSRKCLALTLNCRCKESVG